MRHIISDKELIDSRATSSVTLVKIHALILGGDIAAGILEN